MSDVTAAPAGTGKKAGRKERSRARLAAAQKEAEKVLSAFQKIIHAPRFVSEVNLTMAQCRFGVYVLFDFENAWRDFPPGFNMTRFKDRLEFALRRKFNAPYIIRHIYGAGTFSVFNKLVDFAKLLGHRGYTLEDIPNRLSKCKCGKPIISHGDSVVYERTSDLACDLISQEMSAYPIIVGHSPELPCNVLVISRDRDLGPAMEKLKSIHVTVMLAYTGKRNAAYLSRSATQGCAMSFRQVFDP